MTTNEMRAKLQSARQKCTDVWKATTEETPEVVRAQVFIARCALETALEKLEVSQ